MPLKQFRRTPWDADDQSDDLLRAFRSHTEREAPSESAKRWAGHQEVFCLHGLYVFDPRGVTSKDFREFLWAGLRCLRAEARARGMSDERIRQLLSSAFEVFHDAADSMWTTLKAVVSREGPIRLHYEDVPAPAEPFLPCEEDRPVPLEMHYREPLTLLDPDADLASSEF